MKKLMIAVVIVCAAAFAQATTVNWGGAIAAPGCTDYSTPLVEGQIALLLFSDAAFSGAATSIDGLIKGSTADNGGTVVSTYTLNDTDAGTMMEFTGSYDNPSASANGYYAILIANEAGTAATYQDMGQITGTDEKTGTVYLKYNSGWAEGGNKQLALNGYTVAVGAVPEPTSGLLLLLGVAGLALRRRRA